MLKSLSFFCLKSFCRLFFLTALLLAPLAALQAVEPLATPAAPDATFSQIAQPSGFTPEIPKLSDVCMRLFSLGRPGVSAEQIIDAGRDFHITRGVWSYIVDKSFIEKVRAQGWEFQGTLSGNTSNRDHALLDREGQPLESHFNQWWADPSNPGYREEYARAAKRWIDSGATSLQRDDPQFGEWHWRGKRDTIPEAELLEFHRWARGEIERHAGRKITISTNTAETRPFVECFDYRMTEIRFNRLSPSYLLETGREARRQGMLFVVTGQEEHPVEEFRLAMAGCYATGNLLVLPWDQFNVAVLKDPDAQRTFIAPEHLADLSGFVRANAHYLDGYEDAAVGGHDLKETRYGPQPSMLVQGGSGKLCAFLRARPGDQAAPVVLHLVEWGQGAPATLRLPTARFFGKSPLQVKLRVPLPYDAALHAQAEQDKNYRSLLRETTLTTTTEGAWTLVPIPALSPWGILVVEESR